MTSATEPLSGTARAVTSARAVYLAGEDDWDGWRDASRRLLGAGIEPEAIIWSPPRQASDLFAQDADLPPSPQITPRVPRSFIPLAKSAILHSDSERFALLYRFLFKLTRYPDLMSDRADPLLRRIDLMAKAVRRDMHKMHAFVRFREVDNGDGSSRFVAWFEPDHHIVRANAGFFVRRFAQMQWSILTPELCIHWDGETLTETPGAERPDGPGDDRFEEAWKTYYGAIFNPARLKVKAMMKEMPRKYWKNLPEADLIAPLIASAQARESNMVEQVVPTDERARTLEGLAEEAQGCRRCPLWKGASGCVFGEGPGDAAMMIVGEQPGDEEDRGGRPFIGPAGQVLERALGEAGIDRREVYLTNAVKHFKYVMRGKRRLHQNPNAAEIDMCKWWLDQETSLIKPRSTVMLGATAVRGVTGKPGAIGKMRETELALPQGSGTVSWHPSYILRVPDREAADRAFAQLVDDLRQGAERSR